MWPIAILFGLFFFVRALLAFFHLSSIFEVHGVVHLHATRPRAAHLARGGADCNVFRVSSPYALAALSVYFCVSTSWVASGTVRSYRGRPICVCAALAPLRRVNTVYFKQETRLYSKRSVVNTVGEAVLPTSVFTLSSLYIYCII